MDDINRNEKEYEIIPTLLPWNSKTNIERYKKYIAIFKIKKIFNNHPDKKKKELVKFKQSFEKNFYGIPLYKEAGCSNARLSEYLECLISTDGKNCKIYYTQMRIVD